MSGKDWEAIEREYRAGQLSVREIGRVHKVSHTAINKRAQAEKWPRDVSRRVRQEITSRLVSAGVANDAQDGNSETATERGVAVVLSHRQDISRLRALSQILTDRLEEYLTCVPPKNVKPGTADSMNRMLGASNIMERLSRIRARLIPLERQAFNLDSELPDEGAGSDNELTIHFVSA